MYEIWLFVSKTKLDHKVKHKHNNKSKIKENKNDIKYLYFVFHMSKNPSWLRDFYETNVS